MNTLKITLDDTVDSHEAARAIEAGVPIEEVEMLLSSAPLTHEATTDPESFVGILTREQAMHLREIEADAAFDRRFGHA